jgi:hypothetical protein
MVFRFIARELRLAAALQANKFLNELLLSSIDSQLDGGR